MIWFLPLRAQTSPVPQFIAETALLQIGLQPWVVADIGNHHDVHCIIDTGSSDAGVLPSRLAGGATYVRSVRVQTANGTVAMPEVSITKVAIGSASIAGVTFYLRDQSWFDVDEPMPCIIGRNFLKRFTVDLDGRAGRMRLYPQGTRIDDVLGGTPPGGTHLAASILDDHLIRLDAMVGDIRVNAALDTGWGLATPNDRLLEKLDVRPGDPRIVEKDVTSTQLKRTSTIKMIELRGVRLGNLLVESVPSSVGEANMRVVVREKEPYLHIGWEMLSHHRLLLDLKHKDIALVP